MPKSRLFLAGLSFILLTTLTGCFDLLAIPNIGVSADDDWVAYLSYDAESEESLFQLRAVNTTDGRIISFSEADEQGAFAWHPDENRIAYYNYTPDETTTIRISSVDDPSTGEDIIGSFAFPSNWFVTQMAFSPDGNQLAMTVILSEDQIISDIESEETVSSARELGLTAALYIANLADGSVNQITSPNELFPSLLTWSPTGSYIAYVGWIDGNEDDYIDVSGSSFTETGGDTTTIGVYDVAANTTTTISDGATLDLSPTWIGEATLAYIIVNPATINLDNAFYIRAYDASTSSSLDLFDINDLGVLALGINASPDGNKLAFVGLEPDDPSLMGDDTTEDESGPALPAPIYVLDIASGELQLVYEYQFDPELFTSDDSGGMALDVPVWTQDGTGLIIASGNPLTTLLLGATLSFGGQETSPTTPSLPAILVDLETGEATTIITEPIGSSGFLQSIITLAEAFSSMESDFEDFD